MSLTSYDKVKMSLDILTEEFREQARYKETYECLVHLPLVQELLRKIEELENRNEALVNHILNLSSSSGVTTKKEKPRKTQRPLLRKIQSDRGIIDLTKEDENEDEDPETQPEPEREEETQPEEPETEVVEEPVEEEKQEESKEAPEPMEEVEEVEEKEEAIDEAEEEETQNMAVEESPPEEGEGEEEQGEDEVFEIEIDGKTYYTSDEVNGIIYDIDETGEVSVEVGQFKDGDPQFF